MPVHYDDGKIYITANNINLLDLGDTFCIHLQDFERYLTARDILYPGTSRVQEFATTVVFNNPTESNCRKLIEAVWQWGGNARNLSRVRDGNGELTISEAFEAAIIEIKSEKVERAVTEISNLRRVGWSFSSKIIRFLAPNSAVILDSIISKKLGYIQNTSGYKSLITDCINIREKHFNIFSNAIPLCDVEAAIFIKIKTEMSAMRINGILAQ